MYKKKYQKQSGAKKKFHRGVNSIDRLRKRSGQHDAVVKVQQSYHTSEASRGSARRPRHTFCSRTRRSGRLLGGGVWARKPGCGSVGPGAGRTIPTMSNEPNGNQCSTTPLPLTTATNTTTLAATRKTASTKNDHGRQAYRQQSLAQVVSSEIGHRRQCQRLHFNKRGRAEKTTRTSINHHGTTTTTVCETPAASNAGRRTRVTPPPQDRGRRRKRKGRETEEI